MMPNSTIQALQEQTNYCSQFGQVFIK